jgi:Uma2 family endonuclease
MVIKDTVEGMSLADFMRLWDEEGPFELIDGERIPVPTKMFGNIRIANKLMLSLNTHALAKGLGEAYVEATFVLTMDTPNWVKGARIPDVMYIRAERWAAYHAANPDWETKPLILVPDIVVEIVSENDDYPDVTKKIIHYFKDGVQQVWLIEPQSRVITVYIGNIKNLKTLLDGDVLTGGDTVPGFEIAVSDLLG